VTRFEDAKVTGFDGRKAADFQGRKVLVVGLGTSGFAAAHALLSLGANVRVIDSAATAAIEQRASVLRSQGAEVEVDMHDLQTLDTDLAIVSPGIPPTAPMVRALTEAGIEVWSEVELAYRLARCDFLAITGTNGKTTTTSLLAAMLAEGGVPSVAAGNIGLPLVEAVTAIPDEGAVAVEVSSFQLANIVTFSPKVAVLLNIAEDHTDWHGSLDAYSAAKARIVEMQTAEDVFVVNFDDPMAMRVAERACSRVVPFSATKPPSGTGAAVGISDGRVMCRDQLVFDVEDVRLRGRGGLEDAIAAAGAALEYGIDRSAVATAVQGFDPLPHRFEVIAQLSGVSYIDDSKATNPHATLAAVRGLSNVVLIAGGRSKRVDLAALADAVPPVTAVIAMGEAAPEVEEVFRGLVPVQRAPSMMEAVQRAAEASVAGGSVLLSPGCASLDMYESYEARGEAFACAVHRLSQALDS
jgi:UDP-N-acetylmuramoylalanine--D-glutamate ligase